MQPSRTLAQILAESNSVYDPQVASVQGQIDALPGQTAAEEQGLQAKQTQAFGDILNGARRRGLGFSGIPIGEQAQYTATNYLPALANLRTAQQQRATSLQDAILGIRERQNQFAQGVYQTEQDRAEQARQFDAAQAAQRAQAASYAGLFNQGNPQAPAPQNPSAPDPYAAINKNNANKAIHDLLNSGNVALVKQTVDAITKSAANGNLYDKYKLELLKAATQSNGNAAFNNTYAKLLADAAKYQAPAPKPAVKTQISNFVTKPGSGNLSTGNLMNNLYNWFGIGG